MGEDFCLPNSNTQAKVLLDRLMRGIRGVPTALEGTVRCGAVIAALLHDCETRTNSSCHLRRLRVQFHSKAKLIDPLPSPLPPMSCPGFKIGRNWPWNSPQSPACCLGTSSSVKSQDKVLNEETCECWHLNILPVVPGCFTIYSRLINSCFLRVVFCCFNTLITLQEVWNGDVTGGGAGHS